MVEHSPRRHTALTAGLHIHLHICEGTPVWFREHTYVNTNIQHTHMHTCTRYDFIRKKPSVRTELINPGNGRLNAPKVPHLRIRSGTKSPNAVQNQRRLTQSSSQGCGYCKCEVTLSLCGLRVYHQLLSTCYYTIRFYVFLYKVKFNTNIFSSVS